MPRPCLPPFDPTLGLGFERVVAVSREKIWRAWTVPEQDKRWFTSGRSMRARGIRAGAYQGLDLARDTGHREEIRGARDSV